MSTSYMLVALAGILALHHSACFSSDPKGMSDYKVLRRAMWSALVIVNSYRLALRVRRSGSRIPYFAQRISADGKHS